MSKKRIKNEERSPIDGVKRKLEANTPQMMAVMNQLLEINGSLKVLNDKLANNTIEIMVGMDARIAALEVSVMGQAQAPELQLQKVNMEELQLTDEQRELNEEATAFARKQLAMNGSNNTAADALSMFKNDAKPISAKDVRVTGDGMSMVGKKLN